MIEIEGIKFHAFHGHFDAERIVGNYFQVDLQFETNVSKAEITDSLNDTVNYREVYNLVKQK